MPDSSRDTIQIADAVQGHWAMRHLPLALLPYAQLMRLERPIGWWLLLLPCWWGLALGQIAAGGGWPNAWHALLFLAGAIIMRGAGCTLNDLADREFDAKVARTRLRPIASGRVSPKAALVFLALQLAAGFLILVQFNGFTIITGICSLVIVAVYPFMKRITHWPQAVLGLAFNWGALVGWTATHGNLGWAALALYAAGIAWTLGYDTIYAHQDVEDDVLVGVKSTALLFGENTRPWLAMFFALAVLLLAASLWLAGAGLAAYLGVAAAALHGAWQVHRFRTGDSPLSLKLFKSNRIFGLLVLAGLLLDSVLA